MNTMRLHAPNFLLIEVHQNHYLYHQFQCGSFFPKHDIIRVTFMNLRDSLRNLNIL